MTTTTSDAARHTIRRVLDDKRQQPGALLPVLHAIQDELGHVPPEAVAEIAEALNLSRALRAGAARRKSVSVTRP